MKKNRNTIALVATVRAMANAYLKRELRLAGLAGLAPTHGSIIDALIKRGEMPMGALADHIRRDKSTVTALVTKLERLGYVVRKPSEADSRLSVVKLTERGETLRAVFADISERMFSIVLDGMDEGEIDRLGRSLGKIIANFARHGEA